MGLLDCRTFMFCSLMRLSVQWLCVHDVTHEKNEVFNIIRKINAMTEYLRCWSHALGVEWRPPLRCGIFPHVQVPRNFWNCHRGDQGFRIRGVQNCIQYPTISEPEFEYSKTTQTLSTNRIHTIHYQKLRLQFMATWKHYTRQDLPNLKGIWHTFF